MRNYQENWWKRVAHSYFSLALMAVFILFFAWSVIKFAGKAQETARNKKIAQEKLTELQKQQSQLGSDIDELNTEKGVEESIREKFGLAKDGEGLVVVVDDQNKPATQVHQKTSFWEKIKSWFK